MILLKLFYKNTPKLYWSLIFIIVLMACALIALSIILPDEQSQTVISDIFSPLFNLLATIGLFLGAIQSRKISKRLSWGWGILAIAQFSFFLGDFLWTILELGLKISPYPSIADGAYLIYYPLFLAGILFFPSKPFGTTEWIKRTLELSIVMFAAVLGYWIFLLGPIIQNNGTDFLESFLSIAYPVGDLLLLFALLVIIYFRPEKNIIGSIWILALGILVTVVIDSIYSYQSTLEIYQSGGIVDYGWVFAYILFAFAGIYQAVAAQYYKENATLPHHIQLIRDKISRWLSYLPYLWVVAAYLLIFLIYHNSDLPITFDHLFIGVGCIIVLVIIRQLVGISENNHLLANLQMAIEQEKLQAYELDKSNANLRQEIIKRNLIETKLVHDALHDGLTGLANRILFMDRLKHSIESGKRGLKYHYSLLFLDLDNFKTINDGLGHSAGDKVLVEIGQRLQECTRATDTVARFGGDEFLVLLENTLDDNAAINITHRILNELEQPIILKNKEIQMTCSIGIVKEITDYLNPDDIVRDADIAMYRAKENGKACYELFSPDMRQPVFSRLAIESDLRRALLNSEFTLYYQPIYSLGESHIVGLEALLRWNHPFRGLLAPSEFIDVAEKSGLIIQMGDWVIHEACSQLHTWQCKFPYLNYLVVNVNISGIQINQRGFADKVKETLRKTGLNPNNLKLEVTESTFIDYQIVLNNLLYDLRNVGVSFMIDDFGTGYSSLSYLKKIPVNTIKIDKTFVADILNSETDFEIIKAIILMAHVLGMDTVAEGIENEEQLIKLKSLNCKYGQGFYLSTPRDANAIDEILEHQLR
jgi:diguanylate cyclase (GGDEF)-like protein